MSDVLVLNKHYFAVKAVSWQRAVTLLYKGAAEALDDNMNRYDFREWCELSQMKQDGSWKKVQTSSIGLLIPEIIILMVYDRYYHHSVRFNRKNLFAAYKKRCCYCGEKYDTSEINLDHVVPRSRGGKTSWGNIVLSCIPCNTKKGNKTPEEAKMRMHYRPSQPKHSVTFLGFSDMVSIKSSWQKFVDAVYWNSEIKQE